MTQTLDRPTPLDQQPDLNDGREPVNEEVSINTIGCDKDANIAWLEADDRDEEVKCAYGLAACAGDCEPCEVIPLSLDSLMARPMEQMLWDLFYQVDSDHDEMNLTPWAEELYQRIKTRLAEDARR